ncbi:MAG: GDSL-type esterase/lipase family protein [bacterium]|nr:GDSL-type esterase/lipase family protein [bacterium]
MQSLESSPLAKILMAVLIFACIIGGWRLYTHHRETGATLPDDHAQQGNCVLWFVGSSSIHRWTSLDRDMAPWIAHNRGINGATFADILPRFANVEPTDARPRAIILYVGENDIATGVPVRTTIRQLGAFLDLRSRKLGDVPVLILSMKPSPGRRANFHDQQLFNGAALRLIPHARQAYYVDITTPLLKDGKLGDNYQPDGVHMNGQGYRIWAGIVRQRLADILPRPIVNACAPAR